MGILRPSDLSLSSAQAQTVYFEDFEQGHVGSEWSKTSTDITPKGQERFLGQFGKSNNQSWVVGNGQLWPVSNNQNVTLTLTDLLPHSEVKLSFDLYIIGGWDGDVSEWYGPDIWTLSVRGGETLLRTSFANVRDRQSYPGMYPGDLFPRQTEAAETNVFG